MVNYHSLVPGSYYDSIMVSSEEAGNSPQFVHVSLVVWPCPVLTVEDSEFNFTIFEGETVSLGDSVMLTSSGPSEIYWVATNPGYFIASPSEGTTPSSTFLTYERTFETFGTYADTLVFAGSNPSDTAWPCLPETMAIVNVNVVRLPSADTIIVVSTPAVPGMRLEVPVLFSNSCPLEGMSLVLAWDNEEIHLDSVSFVGSAVEYMDSKGAYETVYNNMDQVSIYANVDEPPLVPVGSQQLFATMHFALSCEIEDGAYEFVLGEDSAMPSIAFIRDCGEGPEVEIPGYIPGSTIVGTATNFVCGYVVDPDMNEIEGATVELWDDYPTGAILMTTTSSSIGSFAFDDITTIPFDLYAYKDGYYPGKIENNNFGDKGGIIILEPVQELIETISWVDYGCPAEGNTYFGAPVPVGSVVEAFTPDSLLVGQFTVTLAGSYGYMPVYRASSELGDDGVVAGETIWFTINGLQAVAYGNTVYPTENIEVQVCLEVRGEVLKECDLVGGWNLISWNVDTESDDIAEVLSPIMGSVEVVRGFEQGGLTYDPDLPEFSTLWDVDHLSGYLVRIDPDVDLITLEVTGLPVPETTPIALTARWNLVSYLPEVDMATSSALGPILDNLVVAVGFDPVTGIAIYRPDGGEFNTLETMSTCSGYWLKVVENDVLTYPGTFGGTAIAAEGMPVKNRVVTTPGIDQASISTTNWIDLYSRNLTVDGHLVEAGTTITAHAADDNSLIGSFTLTTHGKFGFMPVYADDAGEETTGMLPGDNFYLKVGETRTTDDFVWSTNGDCVEVVALSTGGTDTDNVPISYSLDQNYPNPFNPTTTISFSLPNTGTAKIEVFNVLGRLIATPFDGEASSGENQVVWNGRDQNGSAVASGVYFYRLSADNYTETRKMMLLK
ncbi:MAG: hypothetical protein DRP45_08750 [Candidatus Zixiibacteriota bacterium]|nr:MAG: hypothetical protein DRP45_08750 [candidate division Zixibacteria bacterium]